MTTITRTIRRATEADFDAIVTLLHQFAQFQKTPGRMKMTAAQLKDDKELFQCLIAETPKRDIAGFISFFPAYYSWSGRAMYVDDLYVKPEHRGEGIGGALLQSVIDIAKANGSTKVRWQVSGWNEAAIAFYQRMGAVTDGTEHNCYLVL